MESGKYMGIRSGTPAQAALKRAVDESFVSAFCLVALLGAALALLSALAAWWLIAGKHLERAGGTASQP